MADFQSMSILEKLCRETTKLTSSSASNSKSNSKSNSVSKLCTLLSNSRPSITQLQKLILLATRSNNRNAIYDILIHVNENNKCSSNSNGGSNSNGDSNGDSDSNSNSNSKNLSTPNDVNINNDDKKSTNRNMKKKVKRKSKEAKKKNHQRHDIGMSIDTSTDILIRIKCGDEIHFRFDGYVYGDTLLHLMCRKYGWNSCLESVIKFLQYRNSITNVCTITNTSTIISPTPTLSATITSPIRERNDNANNKDSCGELFSVNTKMETPLQLACAYGCTPSDILSSILCLNEQQNKFVSLASPMPLSSSSLLSSSAIVMAETAEITQETTDDKINDPTTISTRSHPPTALLSQSVSPSLSLLSNDQHQLHFIKLIAQYADNDQNEINNLLSCLMKINPNILSVVHNNEENENRYSNDDNSNSTGRIGHSVESVKRPDNDRRNKGHLAIHWACYYQNPSLIQYCLLHSPFDKNGGLDKVSTMSLLSINSQKCKNKSESATSTSTLPSTIPSTTPLDYLVMNLGSCDDQYTWQCLDSCMHNYQSRNTNSDVDYIDSVTPFLQLIVENINYKNVRNVLLKKKILSKIITRYDIDLIGEDRNNTNMSTSANTLANRNTDYQTSRRSSTILVSAIRKSNEWKTHEDENSYDSENKHYLFHDFCHYLSQLYVAGTTGNDDNSNSLQQLSSIRDTFDNNRLPLHIALEYNIVWNNGISLLLNTNIDALEEIDPLTNLAPFMLAAATFNTKTSTLSAINVVRKEVKKKSKKKKTRNCHRVRTNDPDLDTIFELLRHRPTMI